MSPKKNSIYGDSSNMPGGSTGAGGAGKAIKAPKPKKVVTIYSSDWPRTSPPKPRGPIRAKAQSATTTAKSVASGVKYAGKTAVQNATNKNVRTSTKLSGRTVAQETKSTYKFAKSTKAQRLNSIDSYRQAGIKVPRRTK